MSMPPLAMLLEPAGMPRGWLPLASSVELGTTRILGARFSLTITSLCRLELVLMYVNRYFSVLPAAIGASVGVQQLWLVTASWSKVTYIVPEPAFGKFGSGGQVAGVTG